MVLYVSFFFSPISTSPQRDFSRREELQQSDVERWLGFITFLCEVFGTMRSSSGEPFRVLVCPIYTCLREVCIQIYTFFIINKSINNSSAPSMFSSERKVFSRACISFPFQSIRASSRSFLFLAKPSLDSRHHSMVWLVVQTVRTPSVPGKCMTPGSLLIRWSCSLHALPWSP